MLDLRRLEVLHRFAALGTIAATAAELGYSPSAISQQLSTLEREAGVGLIERTAQRASLTDAGRELADHAAQILGAVENAQARMRARTGTVAGRVDVSSIPSLAPVLAARLAALQRRYPDLSVVAHETGSGSAAAAVLDRSYDLAVIDDWEPRPPTGASGLAVHVLCREPVVLAVPDGHALAERSASVGHRELRELVRVDTWLCAPAGQLSREAGDRRLDAAQANPVRRWEFEGLHILAELVAAGAGVALLPAGLVRGRRGATAVDITPRMHRSVLALNRTTAQHDPVIAACLSAARGAIDDYLDRSGISSPR